MQNYFILFLSWSFYLLVHSLLASSLVKKWIRLPKQIYRLLYSLLSTLGLLYLLYLVAIAPPHYFYSVSVFTKYSGMILASWGTILIFSSFRKIPLSGFLGLKKEDENGLITKGIHGYVRHPIYSGTVLLMLGMFVSVPSAAVLISTLSILFYLPFGIYWEEQKLIATYGEAYLEYKKSVKAIIPRVL